MPLVPGVVYAAAAPASGSDTQTFIELDLYGSGPFLMEGADSTHHFTINDLDSAADGTLTHLDVDFVIDGTAAGYVHYSAGPRGVLDNDAGASVDAMTAALVAAPAHGQLTLHPDGTFSYTPDAGYVGADSFTYAASDGDAASAPTTVTIAVTPKPVVVHTPTSGTPQATLTIDGHLDDVYFARTNGVPAAPLAAAQVFDDTNDNGLVDPGETVASTDLNGHFLFTLPAGVHTIRPVPRAGWTAPGGYAGFATVANGASFDLYVTMEHPIVINVLAVHPLTGSILDFAPAWTTDIRNAFAYANQIFANSNTDIRLNLVTIKAAQFTPSDDLDLDLRRLEAPNDGTLDTVPALRDKANADLAILFESQEGKGGVAGVAPLLNPAKADAARGFAVAVAETDAALGGTILAHEIGHTLGAEHDVQHDDKTQTAYAHGYRFTGNGGIVYRDVMAYAPGVSLPFFSSPLITYAGHALGTTGGSDAARIIRENAAAVASYRGPKVTANPIFSGEPIVAASTATAKSAVKLGTAIPLSAIVRNATAANFTGKATVAFYLSEDKALDPADMLLKRVMLNAKNLKSGSTLTASSTEKLPATLGAGTYYLFAVATTTGKAADELVVKFVSATLKVAAPPKKTGGKSKSLFASALIKSREELLQISAG